MFANGSLRAEHVTLFWPVISKRKLAEYFWERLFCPLSLWKQKPLFSFLVLLEICYLRTFHLYLQKPCGHHRVTASKITGSRVENLRQPGFPWVTGSPPEPVTFRFLIDNKIAYNFSHLWLIFSLLIPKATLTSWYGINDRNVFIKISRNSI
jgi:hypothetical protein